MRGVGRVGSKVGTDGRREKSWGVRWNEKE